MILPLPDKLAKIRLLADSNRIVCLLAAAIIFLALFLPCYFDSDNFIMFWKMDGRIEGWQITASVLALGLAGVAAVFKYGIIRGGAATAVGFLLFVLAMILMTRNDSGSRVMFYLAQMFIAVALGGVSLKMKDSGNLAAKLTAAVAGALAAVFFLIGMIIYIVDFTDIGSPSWSVVLDFIAVLLLTLLGGAAGLLSVASLFNIPKLAILGRICQFSILGYIVLWVGWGFVGFIFTWIDREGALVFGFTDRLYSSCLMAVMAVGAVELVSGALALLKPKPQAA